MTKPNTASSAATIATSSTDRRRLAAICEWNVWTRAVMRGQPRGARAPPSVAATDAARSGTGRWARRRVERSEVDRGHLRRFRLGVEELAPAEAKRAGDQEAR